MKKPIAFLTAALLLFLSSAPSVADVVRPISALSEEEGRDPARRAGDPVFEGELRFIAEGDAERRVAKDKNGEMTVTLTEPEGGEDPPGGQEERRRAVARATVEPESPAPSVAAVDLLYIPEGDGSPSWLDVTVEFVSDGKTVSFREKIAPGAKRTLFCDLAPLGQDGKIIGMSVDAEWSPGRDGPGKLKFSAPRVSDLSYPSAVGKMSSLSLSANSGSAEIRSGFLAVTAVDNIAELSGAVDPEALAEVPEGGEDDRIYYAEIRIEATGGSVSAGFFRDGEESDPGSETPQTTSPIALQKGEHSYLFRVPYGKTEKYRIELRGEDRGSFRIKYLRFHRTAKVVLNDETPCTVTRMEIEDGEIICEGRLRRKAVEQYSGEKLALYTSSFYGGEPTVLATAKVSGNFSFREPVRDIPQGGIENLYWIEVVGGERGVPVTLKQFPSVPKVDEDDSRAVGLHGAAPAGVFETGVSRAMIDVDLDSLSDGSEGGVSNVAVSRGSDVFYINGGVVKKLDDDMKFYDASNVDVFLRFVTSDATAWFPRGAEEGPEEERGRFDLYLAAVSFFCARYRNIVSVCVPDIYNSVEEDPWERAYRTALLARLTSSAACRDGRSVSVSVPAGRDVTDSSSEMLASFVSEAFRGFGNVNWSMTYFSPDASFPGAEIAVSSTLANETPGPSFCVLCYVPGKNVSVASAAKTFAGLCEERKEDRNFSVFMSLSEIAPDGLLDDFSLITPAGAAGVSTAEYLQAEDLSSVDFGLVKGNKTLWDFTGVYSNEGWTPGTGIDFLGNVYLKDRGSRAIHCRLGEDDSFGIVLCPLPEDADLEKAPLVEFDVSLRSDDGAEIVFLFDGENGRSEYTAYTGGGAEDLRLFCDLSKRSKKGRIGYIAVLIRSEGTVDADFSKVVCHSTDLTDEELNVTKGPGKKGFFDNLPTGRNRIYLMAALAIATLATVWMAVHCFRSDRDFSFVQVKRGSRSDGRRQS